MKRKIIKIEEEKCTGCGVCIPSCPEGAIQIIDGKARLISDRFCDGLGACLNDCPENAITVEEREAEPYDEVQVMEAIVKQGNNVILAHLKHLKDHGETELLSQAMKYLKDHQVSLDCPSEGEPEKVHHGCPGSMAKQFKKPVSSRPAVKSNSESQLTHWPVQLHLLSPLSPAYKKADVVLSADCVPFAYADFHSNYLKGKSLAIACPKLDDGQDIYVEKLTAMIDQAEINSLTVLIMEVPCCRGLVQMARNASQKANRQIPIRIVVVSLDGRILSEEEV